MKDFKITNYTTMDWLKQMGSMLCFIYLVQLAIHEFVESDWFHGLMTSLGALGWLLIYIRINREIHRKNHQEVVLNKE